MSSLFSKYYNKKLGIAFVSLFEVYLMSPEPIKLIPESKGGTLQYRIPKTSKRIGYKTIKQGLQQQRVEIFNDCPF
jgi:hypothetical protein